MKTHVPPEMMMEGWTAADPCTATNCSAERDVFTWLMFGTPIENVMDMYEGWLTRKKATTFSEKVKAYLLAWQYGKCHHHVNTWLKQCSVCDEHHTECIQYLNELKARVIKYYKAKEQYRVNSEKEVRDHRAAVGSSRYFQILGLAEGVSVDEIKRRYRELVRMWHPDLYPSNPRRQQICEEKLKEFNEAYEYFKQKEKC